MSLDGESLHDDIYEYYLIDDVRQNRLRNNSNTSQSLFLFMQYPVLMKTQLIRSLSEGGQVPAELLVMSVNVMTTIV